MRKIWDIHGGIHPPENKQQSLKSTIGDAGIPDELVLPLSQHIGAPAKAIVSAGENVLKGQMVAAAEGPVSVPVHAPSSGTVSAIEPRDIPHASGMQDLCIVIQTDGNDNWVDLKTNPDWQALDNKTLLELIRNAGIAGMGGAGFPAAIKLNAPPQKAIDTLILNGTECEPYITADHALLRERTDALAEGIAVLCKLIAPKKIIVGIEDNKLDTIDGVKQALSRIDFNALVQDRDINIDINVTTFPTKYPSGGEKQLIEILTGKQVPKGGLPADLGIVCQNLGTAIAIRDAVIDGKPLISRITTLTGEAIAQKGNVDVLLGTPISYLLDKYGFDKSKNNRLVMGGPMMGFALKTSHAPVIKTTNCILAPTEQELPTPPPAQPCIRCGMCAEACPASLLPQQLFWFAQGKELEKLTAHNIADCIECGACSYVCPSHIPLVQYYRASKAEIRQRDLDMANADASKARFDARQARLERLEAEKAAARKARQEKAKARSKAANKAASKAADNGDTEQDAKAATIAAAVARSQAKKAEAALSANPNDPVAKAMAARAAQATAPALNETEKAQQAVDKLAERLSKAKQRLADAESNNDENIAAFKTAVEKTQNKLDAARATLADLPQTAAEDLKSKPATDQADKDSDDPVARALAKRAAAAAAPALSDSEKAIQNLERAEQRLEKAKTRLAKAEAEGDANLSAFKTAVEKAEDKVQQAKAAVEST